MQVGVSNAQHLKCTVMQVGVSDAQHLEMVRSYARVVFYSTSQKNGTNSSMWGLEGAQLPQMAQSYEYI